MFFGRCAAGSTGILGRRLGKDKVIGTENEIKDLEVFVIMEYCGRIRVEEVPLLLLKDIFYVW